MANFELVPDLPWPGAEVDPYVRLAVARVETEGSATAIPGSDPDVLELLLELKPGTPQTLLDALKVPKAYQDARHVTATMDRSPTDMLRTRVAELHGQVERLKLALRQQQRLAESLRNMGPGDPPWGTDGKYELDGRGVIVGVIDDGCAFAHRNFLEKTSSDPAAFKSRVLYLWDQCVDPKKKGDWKQPEDFGYGHVLRQAQLDAAIAAHVSPGKIDENEIYQSIDYTVPRGAHGTHVLDIAVGNGESVTASRGVAPKADIIFVQIPKDSIGHPADSALASFILDGVMYIFARAREANKPAVINISYGGYGGPHDGTSLIERGIDELLAKENGRAVVISAGNGLDEDCHASGTIPAGKASKPLTWIVGENDPTLNLLEVWYDGSELSLTLTPPNGPALSPVPAEGEKSKVSIRADGKIIGWVFHRKQDPVNKSGHIIVALRPTERGGNGSGNSTNDKVAPGPAGSWKVQLNNLGQAAADFHAWIERDDAGQKDGVNPQSKFAFADSSRRCTLGSLATGRLTISVGAYNTATQEVSKYSAAGPTRDKRSLSKPDVCAPGEEDATGNGILSVHALADPKRMSGTSMSAPHVAGLVALMFQRAGRKRLSAEETLLLVRKGAKAGTQQAGRGLAPNGRWQRNDGVLPDCTGEGKVNAVETLALIPPGSAV